MEDLFMVKSYKSRKHTLKATEIPHKYANMDIFDKCEVHQVKIMSTGKVKNHTINSNFIYFPI